ncbi:winged helix-turn-helix domain-containing protein [Shewanella sedimentimangrovi]|uniref:Winged helix-turn-helix domain-containing protein n=1 Tax=Shewanella sedimentimangrovi TaxID=2814293 RepID=A0ABX7QXB8_9GAMM|nr:winged helix-turn-helix domain-containing protein [Shewanella sedimentimangrovi]QSX35677.1 winged helix-turn-helix domain-containing protein [Shewanella sedimentimangrovi]
MKYRFDDFCLDTELFSLTKADVEQPLEPRIFQLLTYFCMNPNRPISRDELIDEVWGKRIVSAAAINRAVSELRKIVEPNSSAPVYLKTISKIGYSFAAEVKTEEYLVQTKKDSSLQPENACHPLIGKFNGFTFSAVLILLQCSYLILSYFSTDTMESRKVGMQELRASPQGVSFRAQLSPFHDGLLFINRSSHGAIAQIWYQEGRTPPRSLTTGEYYYLHAIFTSENDVYASRFNNLHDRLCEIVSINIKTAKITPIFDCSPRSIPVLAYNEELKQLYFNHRNDVNEPYSIYQYQIKTGRLQQLTRPSHKGNARGDYILALSPDKKTLAIYEYQLDSTSRLKFLDLQSEESHYAEVLFPHPSSLSWLNNEQLVTVTDEGVQLYDRLTDSIRPLLTSPDIGYASVDSNTHTFVFDRYQQIGNLYQYSIIQNQLTQKSPATTADLFPIGPSYANQSQKLAFFTQKDGVITLKIVFDSNLQTIKFPEPISGFTNLSWSPDGNYFIAGINNGLYRYDLNIGQWETLVPNIKQIHYVHYANADTLLFSSEESGDWQIWALDLQSNILSQVSKYGGYSVQGNPDSGTLYLTKFNQPGLFSLDVNSGEEALLIEDAKITSWAQWQLRSNHLYLATSEGIAVYDDKGQRLATLNTPVTKSYGSFSVSGDETQLVMSELDHESGEIWQAQID